MKKKGERKGKPIDWILNEGRVNITHNGSMSRKIISHIEILTLNFKFAMEGGSKCSPLRFLWSY